MTNEIEKTAGKKELFVHTAQLQMDFWRDGLDQLNEVALTLPAVERAVHQGEIAALRNEWHELELRFDDLQAADGKQWEEARTGWGGAASDFWQAFLQTADLMQGEQNHLRQVAGQAGYPGPGIPNHGPGG